MAQIILEPKEEFEHFHSEPSYTELKEGKVMYEAAGIRQLLVLGEKIETPAKQAHTITNIGENSAIVSCYHR